MTRSSNRLTLTDRSYLLDTLESRQLLGGSSNVIDFDLDEFSVTLNGPGTASVTMGANGVALLQISGSNSTTDVVISRTGQSGDGRLRIHRLGVSGDLDELRSDEFVDFEPVGIEPAAPGINITGRIRSIDIQGGVFGSDITIGATGNNNRSSIYIRAAFGESITTLAPGPDPTFVDITSGGIIERLEIDNANFVTATARRFNVVDLDQFNILRGPKVPIFLGMTFEVTATETNAPYGIKTIEVDGPIFNGDIFSNSPVQSIIIDEVSEFLGGSGGRFIGTSLLRGNGPNLVGSLDVHVNGRLGSFKARTGSYRGNLEATSFGAIDVADYLDANIRGFFFLFALPLSNVHTNGIDSLRAGFVIDSLIEAGGPANNGSGFIKSMIVGEIDNTPILTGWIGTLNVTGSASANADGDVFGSSITLNNTTRARALDQMTVAGAFGGASNLTVVDNNAGSIALNGGFEGNSIIQVGVSNLGLAFTGNPFNGNNRSIASLKLKAPVGDLSVFSDGIIAAKTITSLTSTLRSSDANFGTPFGVVADVISSISFRIPSNSLFTTANTSFSDSDFRIRVI